eukprot:1024286-Alexandrium_andersonii.AAC.1
MQQHVPLPEKLNVPRLEALSSEGNADQAPEVPGAAMASAVGLGPEEDPLSEGCVGELQQAERRRRRPACHDGRGNKRAACLPSRSERKADGNFRGETFL